MQAGDKMRIAVCDDDEGVCSQVERWVLQYNVQKGIRIEVEIYNSAETLIHHFHKGEWYDLLFLDIELPQKNGIELGQMIRKKFGNELTHIVFISGKIDYCTWLFQIEPLNFHYKPLKREKVIQDIEKVIARINIGETSLKYLEEDVYKSIFLKEIIYFKTVKRKTYMQTKKGRQIVLRETLQELNNRYEKFGFCRCHKSCLVNLNYVEEYQFRKIKMTDGTVHPVGEKYAKQFKDAFMEHEFMGD